MLIIWDIEPDKDFLVRPVRGLDVIKSAKDIYSYDKKKKTLLLRAAFWRVEYRVGFFWAYAFSENPVVARTVNTRDGSLMDVFMSERLIAFLRGEVREGGTIAVGDETYRVLRGYHIIPEAFVKALEPLT